MVTLFKKCPNCGRRFEVEHTGESVEEKEELVPEEREVLPPTIVAGGMPSAAASTISNNPPAVEHDMVLEDEKDYTESYKCKHCGYTWTEKHFRVKDEGSIPGSDI